MTPIESWEESLYREFPMAENLDRNGPKNIKDFIRTKLDEAYRKGREDAVEYIKQAHTNSLDSRGETMLNTIGFQKVFDEARAGEVSNQK